MESIIVEFPNRNIINISKYDYENDERYKNYLNIVNNKLVAKELYKVDNIINDDIYWKFNKHIRYTNLFNEYYKYTKKSLCSYKNMLLNINDMLIKRKHK